MDILFFIAVIIWVVKGGLMKSSRSANSSFRAQRKFLVGKF